jgi:hypothetical protein
MSKSSFHRLSTHNKHIKKHNYTLIHIVKLWIISLCGQMLDKFVGMLISVCG